MMKSAVLRPPQSTPAARARVHKSSMEMASSRAITSSCKVWMSGVTMRAPSSDRGVGFEPSSSSMLSAHGNAPALLGEAIAAARSAHALQHARANELLHDLFEITLRYALARRDLFRLHGFRPRIECNVDDRFEREERFAGELEHVKKPELT
jgi:hypothetical protein